MKILVTGATGFIGQALIKRLACMSCHEIIAVGRSDSVVFPDGVRFEPSPDLREVINWFDLVVGVDVAVHCAAIAHVSTASKDQLAGLRKANVDGALQLARQLTLAGVKRLVFISSIGVNGNSNVRPFTVDDVPHPVEPYAQSKWDAEKGLWDIIAASKMELVVIRPPLVYGPNAPGNFGTLVRMVRKGLPLPLGAIQNRRSLVGLDNLVDLIITCIDHPNAANQTFLGGDGEDLSTSELLRRVAKAMGKPSRLIPVPAGMLQFGATLLGKKAVGQRLLGSLQVDISSTRERLDWTPPLSVDEGLQRCFETNMD